MITWNVTTFLIQCGPITHSSTGSKPDSCRLPCDIRPDIMLMPDAMDPSFIIRHRHRMHAYPLETFLTFLCFLLMYFPEFKLEGYSIPHSLGQPRLINLVPVHPPSPPPPPRPTRPRTFASEL